MNAISARVLHTPSGSVDWPVLEVQDGRINAMYDGQANEAVGALSSGFFDIHVHGAMSFDFMSASEQECDVIGAFLATKGVSHYLATTVTADVDTTLKSLSRLASYARKQQAGKPAAAMVGLHLEGPFLCLAKRGVHPADRLLAPDVRLLEQFQQAAEGNIKLLTLAPEIPGALELIEYAVERGIKISLGHSNATAAETLAAIRAGARSATHTFNAMRGLDHREPGIVGTVLDSDSLFAELIADRIHVHPAMVRLWLKAKGARRAILVTDGMAATGMPDGTYRLGDLVVEVRDGVCLSGGVLAGSVLTMDRAVHNLCEMTGAPLATAVSLASHNPAAMLETANLCEIRLDGPATLNSYDDQGRRRGMWIQGQWIAA